MVEIDGYFTVELRLNNKLIESYSSDNMDLIEQEVCRFREKIKPKFRSDGSSHNDTYEIHIYTY